jgi:hypothetical protein
LFGHPAIEQGWSPTMDDIATVEFMGQAWTDFISTG